MKKILYSLFICLAVAFSSCGDDSTKDPSKVTYFVDLQMLGDAEVFWPKGTPYVEPGYSAILQEVDVTKDVAVTGNVDVNAPAIYQLVYSAANEDGFAVALKRTVYVYDTVDSPIESGIYTVSKDSYRDYSGITAFGKTFPVSLFQVSPGTFYISDFIGGWYDQRVGYGPTYAMGGHFKLNADNTITAIDSSLPGFGDAMDKLENGVYDPTTKIITWDIGYAGSMTFHIILNK